MAASSKDNSIAPSVSSSKSSLKSLKIRVAINAQKRLFELETSFYEKQKHLINETARLERELIEEEECMNSDQDDLSELGPQAQFSSPDARIVPQIQNNASMHIDPPIQSPAFMQSTVPNLHVNPISDFTTMQNARTNPNTVQSHAPYVHVTQIPRVAYAQDPRSDPPIPHYPRTASHDSDLANAILHAVEMSQQTTREYMKRNDFNHKDLPQFDGSPSKWPQFYEQYRIMSEEGRLPNAVLMGKLSKALKGKALETVEALLTSPSNLEKIIDTLKLRFGRPELIIRNMIEKVMMIPQIQENALEQLLELSTAVHGLVITMINLQFEGHLTNPQLLSDLTDKLTPYLRFMWGHVLAKWNQRGDLNKFAEWLNRQANAIILVERSIPIKVDSKPKEKVKSPVNKRRSSTTVLTVSGSKKSSPYDRCKACKRTGHELEKCRKFLDLDVDEKWELVIGSKLCFVCLKPNHRVPNCEDREECGEDGCTSLHHKLLHNPNRTRKRSEVHTTTHTTVDESEPKEVLLKILPVQVSGPKGSVQTYALLDEGSTVTLMSEETANKIGVKGKVESLTLNWTDGRTKQKVAAKIVDVKIKGKQGRNHQMNGVKVIKDLNLPLQTVSIKMAEKLGSHVSAKDLVFRSAKPTILIGQDNCHLIISREIVSAGKNGPIASKTDLGWVLHGLINDTNNEEATVLFINQVRDDDLNETVKDYFKIDSLGIKITDPPESEANKKARAIVQATAKRREDFHWEVGLPWKNDQINDDQASYLTAVKRLEIQEKKFQKDPEYAQEYKKKIDDFLEKGYAEKVAEDQDPGKRVCYLPHFGVINKNKPVKKLRIVFDAAAKSDGCSLNDLLLTGPDLLTSLVGTLFSFRSRSVAYLRTETREEIRCTIVIAKSKVSPLKPLSIPRLELQAATVGSRLSTLIQKEHDLKIDRTFFWSDSRTVLSWIRSDARRYKQFVSVRIGEILETTNIEDWRWVPTGENVADDATRNCSSQKDEERWIHGPPFLYLPENSWPQENVGSNSVEDEAELKREYVGFVSESDERYLPDVNRFSSMMKLLRSTAWILRYVRNCRAKAKKQPLLRGDLTVAEIRDAENLWIRQVQVESFGAEIKSLREKGTVPKDSKLYKLTPELASDEIIRLRGRTNNSESLKESTKKPAILDPDHPFTALIIKHYHVICGHQGHETVMNEVRQRYWVLKLRTTVKKLWKLCNFCKIRNAKPQVPQMGSLPEQRVTVQSRPFAVTGLDFFGPLYVTVKRSIEKRYGALFVCMATRAIHIELASSLSTDSAIMAMRRMMSRRGFCEEIISDNGTNFRGASEELKKALQELDQERIKVELAVRGVDWRFNPPAAPHMGGSWERLVRSVKSTLKVILKEQHPREETLLTTLAEVENIVNS